MVTDLTNSLEPNSQAVSDQGITSQITGPGHTEDNFPTASGKAYIGELLYGRYRILSLIAKGGMGEVYKAKIETTDKLVAVKVLSAQLASRKRKPLQIYARNQLCGSIKAPQFDQRVGHRIAR